MSQKAEKNGYSRERNGVVVSIDHSKALSGLFYTLEYILFVPPHFIVRITVDIHGLTSAALRDAGTYQLETNRNHMTYFLRGL